MHTLVYQCMGLFGKMVVDYLRAPARLVTNGKTATLHLGKVDRPVNTWSSATFESPGHVCHVCHISKTLEQGVEEGVATQGGLLIPWFLHRARSKRR